MKAHLEAAGWAQVVADVGPEKEAAAGRHGDRAARAQGEGNRRADVADAANQFACIGLFGGELPQQVPPTVLETLGSADSAVVKRGCAFGIDGDLLSRGNDYPGIEPVGGGVDGEVVALFVR